MKRPARLALYSLLGMLALGLAAGLWALRYSRRDIPERFADPAEEFKFGSIGAEARLGLPWHLWRIMPALCADLIPKRPHHGDSWENFGFLYEHPEDRRPIGISYREKPIGMVGLNCAACHTGVVRDVQRGPRRIVPGMAAQQLDLDGYAHFLARCGTDVRFNERKLISVMKDDPSFTKWDEFVYRRWAIPRTKAALAKLDQEYRHRGGSPGPGRYELMRGHSALLGIEPGPIAASLDLAPAFVDPSQKALGWFANEAERKEIAISHALAAGADDSLDLQSIDRALSYLATLKAPAWPRALDDAKVEKGRALFADRCQKCHGPDGLGGAAAAITPIAELATDSSALKAMNNDYFSRLAQLGGRGWRLGHFTAPEGYANVPLSGLWLRAPYLHNGSVPSLRALLTAPVDRPRRFFRGTDLYDYARVGFDALGCEKDQYDFVCMQVETSGSVYVTPIPGNAASGHAYGIDLTDAEKDALVEFLKTL